MIIVLAALILLFVLVLAVNLLLIKYSGAPVAVPEIPRQSQQVGEGKPLRYVILGDSTAVGQGGTYENGIAVETAKHLAAKGYQVSYQNFAISGARVNDVLTKQLEPSLDETPDVILLSIGANDVTGFTKLGDVRRDMVAIIDKIYQKNSNAKIIITGSPEMGSVPRFPWPTNWLATQKTKRINKVFEEVAAAKNVTFARIAEETGQTFRDHPEYFAADTFHPLDIGYAQWVPVLTRAIDSTGI